MIFNSFNFLWSFPIIFCFYWIFTKKSTLTVSIPKFSNYLLIAVSYGLYLKWKPVYALILLSITVITFFAGLFVERKKTN